MVDDEPYARRKLRGFLEAHPDAGAIEEASDGVAAKEKIASFRPDLVFLDIRMPGLSGLELADALGRESPPYLIFTTAYDAYAARAFELDAVDYLLKPFDHVRFNLAMDRCLRRMAQGERLPNPGLLRQLLHSLEQATLKLPAAAASPVLGVRAGNELRFLRPQEVSYIRARGDYVEIAAGVERIRAREHIGDLEQRLQGDGFVRIHRSVLINKAHIAAIRPKRKGDQEVILDNGETFVSSAAYKANIKALIGQDKS
ncbi:MAG TPA: response regulator [Gammaproteobacteria bacterium]|nr:response regulator [Gammaproteobacteria bacterium]